MPHEPRVGVGAVILRDDQLLLVLRRRPPEADCWSIPGGKVEYMERLEDAVIREIEEEVGLEIADLQLLCVTDYMVAADDAHWVCPTYLAQTVTGEPVNREPTKLGDMAWYPLSDLPSPLTLTTLAAIRALQARGRYSGRYW